MHAKRYPLAAPLLVLALTLATAAQAAEQPAQAQEEPNTLILSDSLHFDDVKRESTFTGNVIMTRGDLTLRSDVLQMREDADGFQFGTATAPKTGQVHIRQVRPNSSEVIEAVGQRAEYDGRAETIEVIGQAVVTRVVCGKPFDNIRGQRIRYNQKTDTYEAHGGTGSAAAGGRVRSMAQPRAKSDAAAAACKDQPAQGGAPAQDGAEPAPANRS